jgi:hypothetical protein
MLKPDALKEHGFSRAENRIPKNICGLQPAEALTVFEALRLCTSR